MKRYIGKKLISAEKMTKLEYTEIHTTEYFSGDDEDGYLIQNHNSNDAPQDDSCFSWLPKDEFEASYRPIDNMTFGLAIEALKHGKKVARAGWNGKGMYVRFVDSTESLNRHFELFNVVGTFDTWVASVSDALAEDWQIIE